MTKKLQTNILKIENLLNAINEANTQEREQLNSLGNNNIDGLYIISVAAKLLDVHPQTLRKYERIGLITPSRTLGMLRLYSQEDIERLKLIRYLEEQLGLNLAGVSIILKLLFSVLEIQNSLAKFENMEIKETINSEITTIINIFIKIRLRYKQKCGYKQKYVKMWSRALARSKS